MSASQEMLTKGSGCLNILSIQSMSYLHYPINLTIHHQIKHSANTCKILSIYTNGRLNRMETFNITLLDVHKLKI